LAVKSASSGRRHASLTQGIEKRLCLSQIGRIEALGEAIVEWLKQRKRVGVLVLIAPRPRNAHGCAQLPRQSALSTRGVKRLPKAILGHGRGPFFGLQQRKLAFYPQQLSQQPTLFEAAGSVDCRFHGPLPEFLASDGEEAGGVGEREPPQPIAAE
jgi:hypothetical protein